MNDDISNTIEVLAKKVAAKEEEANKLKRLVNELCEEAGLPLRYASISDSGVATTIRTDHFYGFPLTAAIRNYLEIRKASNLGAASVSEIYSAIRDGGYKFSTKTEDIAKIVVANNLRKSSSIFHRLPNGQYGLLLWYPNAKAKTDESSGSKKETKGAEKPKRTEQKDTVTNGEIRDVILAQTGEFKALDIEATIKAKFPSKTLPEDKVPTVIFLLKKKGLLKVIADRVGRTPAIYARAG